MDLSVRPEGFRCACADGLSGARCEKHNLCDTAEAQATCGQLQCFQELEENHFGCVCEPGQRAGWFGGLSFCLFSMDGVCQLQEGVGSMSLPGCLVPKCDVFAARVQHYVVVCVQMCSCFCTHWQYFGFLSYLISLVIAAISSSIVKRSQHIEAFLFFSEVVVALCRQHADL